MINIYNIVYDKTSYEERDEYFSNIGMLNNPEPELYEYFHIINFYDSQRSSWNEDDFYGFLSTNFYFKTGLEGSDLIKLLEEKIDGKQLVIINPWWRLFQSNVNSYDKGEENHPGLLNCLRKVFGELGVDKLDELYFSNSKNTTYSNFFVAKPLIWDEWIKLIKKIIEISRDEKNYLYSLINSRTTYKAENNPKMLIFVLERVINYIIKGKNDQDIAAIDSFCFRKDSINTPPLHLAPIDQLRIENNDLHSNKSNEIYGFLWQQRKIDDINQLIKNQAYAAAAAVIKQELFSKIFEPEVESFRLKILMEVGGYQEIISRFEKNVGGALDLKSSLFYYQALIKLNRLSDAQLIIENLFLDYADSHLVTCDYLTILLGLKKYELCVEKINEALHKFPRSHVVPFIASKLSREIGRKDEAEKFSRIALNNKNSRRRFEWS
jgi:hypothetical protein